MSDDRFRRGGDAVAAFARTVAALRERCPWDRQQTHASLRAYLLEEACEALDALDGLAHDGGDAALQEELGDVLFQIVFHAEIAFERAAFDLAAVAAGIDRKLVTRHPHVFGEPGTPMPDWEALKAAEKPGRKQSRLDGIPRALPELSRAARMGEQAAKIGLDWAGRDAVVDKVREECEELSAAQGDPAALEEELGDLLFTLVQLARHLGVDAERALAGATRKFDKRFRYVEAHLQDADPSVADSPLDRVEALWKDAKSFAR